MLGSKVSARKVLSSSRTLHYYTDSLLTPAALSARENSFKLRMRSLLGNENTLLKRDSYFSHLKRGAHLSHGFSGQVGLFGSGKGTPESIGEIKPQHPNLISLHPGKDS